MAFKVGKTSPPKNITQELQRELFNKEKTDSAKQ
jgi:hypothetical protein